MNKVYSFNEKIQILKSLNENLINNNIMFGDLNVNQYDAIFDLKSDNISTLGDEVLLLMWNLSKEYIVKQMPDKLRIINDNYYTLIGYISSEFVSEYNRLQRAAEIDAFVKVAKKNRSHFNNRSNQQTKKEYV